MAALKQQKKTRIIRRQIILNSKARKTKSTTLLPPQSIIPHPAFKRLAKGLLQDITNASKTRLSKSALQLLQDRTEGFVATFFSAAQVFAACDSRCAMVAEDLVALDEVRRRMGLRVMTRTLRLKLERE